MGSITDTPAPLTVAARRRILIEFADLYANEIDRADRPVTQALPTLLPGLTGMTVTTVEALGAFDELARARRTLTSATATTDEFCAAELHAERLLDRLTGEAA